ncbi:MAG: hypothetical protein ACRC5M_04355 [Anaeroplasmataceae bacterium]
MEKKKMITISTDNGELSYYIDDYYHYKNPDSENIDINKISKIIIDINGDLWVDGENSNFNLGMGDKKNITWTKVDLFKDTKIKSVLVHKSTSYVLTEDGDLYVAGVNSYNLSIGLGDEVLEAKEWTKIVDFKVKEFICPNYLKNLQVNAIDKLGYSFIIISENGDSYIFGSNDFHKAGIGVTDKTVINTPTLLGMKVKKIYDRIMSLVIIDADDKMWYSGENFYGVNGIGIKPDPGGYVKNIDTFTQPESIKDLRIKDVFDFRMMGLNLLDIDGNLWSSYVATDSLDINEEEDFYGVATNSKYKDGSWNLNEFTEGMKFKEMQFSDNPDTAYLITEDNIKYEYNYHEAYLSEKEPLRVFYALNSIFSSDVIKTKIGERYVLTNEGKLYVKGENFNKNHLELYGLLGTGEGVIVQTNWTIPEVLKDITIEEIHPSEYACILIDSNRNLWFAGLNYEQTSDDPSEYEKTFTWKKLDFFAGKKIRSVHMRPLDTVKNEIFTSNTTVFVIDNDDNVYVSGNNYDGICGVGSDNMELTEWVPVDILLGYEINNIFFTLENDVFLETKDHIHYISRRGDLDDESKNTWSPVDIKNITIDKIIDNSIIKSVDNRYFAFGSNDGNICGVNSVLPYIYEPIEITQFKDLEIDSVKTEIGYDNKSRRYVLETNGRMWVAGYNKPGCLGIGTNEEFVKEYVVPEAIKNEKIKVINTKNYNGARIINDKDELFVTGYNKGYLGVGNDDEFVLTWTKPESLSGVHIATIDFKDDSTAIYGPLNEMFLGGKNNYYPITNRSTVLNSFEKIYEEILPFPGIEKKRIVVGSSFYVINDSDHLWVYGANNRGQIGIGESELAESWMEPEATLNVVVKDIFVEGASAYIIDDQDQLWVTGDNSNGMIGTGSEEDQKTWIKPLLDSKVKVIHRHYKSFIIEDEEGLLHITGQNEDNRLGLEGIVYTFQNFPMLDYTPVKKFIFGETNSFILDGKDILWTLGDNERGQIGVENTRVWTKPDFLIGDIKVKKFDTKHDSSYVLTTDNNLYVTGANEHGMLGLGIETEVMTWTPILEDLNIKARDFSIYDYTAFLNSNDGKFYVAGSKLADIEYTTENETIWSEPKSTIEEPEPEVGPNKDIRVATICKRIYMKTFDNDKVTIDEELVEAIDNEIDKVFPLGVHLIDITREENVFQPTIIYDSSDDVEKLKYKDFKYNKDTGSYRWEGEYEYVLIKTKNASLFKKCFGSDNNELLEDNYHHVFSKGEDSENYIEFISLDTIEHTKLEEMFSTLIVYTSISEDVKRVLLESERDDYEKEGVTEKYGFLKADMPFTTVIDTESKVDHDEDGNEIYPTKKVQEKIIKHCILNQVLYVLSNNNKIYELNMPVDFKLEDLESEDFLLKSGKILLEKRFEFDLKTIIIKNIFAGTRLSPKGKILYGLFILDNDNKLYFRGHNEKEYCDFIYNFENLKDIKSAFGKTYFIFKDGSVRLSGVNESGSLGSGDENSHYQFVKICQMSDSEFMLPEHVNILKYGKVKDIAIGPKHTVFLFENGKAIGFGSNGNFQLGGDKAKYTNDFIEFKFAGLRFKGINCTTRGTILLTNDGKIVYTGTFINGELGITNSVEDKPIFLDGKQYDEYLVANKLTWLKNYSKITYSKLLNTYGDGVFVCKENGKCLYTGSNEMHLFINEENDAKISDWRELEENNLYRITNLVTTPIHWSYYDDFIHKYDMSNGNTVDTIYYKTKFGIWMNLSDYISDYHNNRLLRHDVKEIKVIKDIKDNKEDIYKSVVDYKAYIKYIDRPIALRYQIDKSAIGEVEYIDQDLKVWNINSQDNIKYAIFSPKNVEYQNKVLQEKLDHYIEINERYKLALKETEDMDEIFRLQCLIDDTEYNIRDVEKDMKVAIDKANNIEKNIDIEIAENIIVDPNKVVDTVEKESVYINSKITEPVKDSNGIIVEPGKVITEVVDGKYNVVKEKMIKTETLNKTKVSVELIDIDHIEDPTNITDNICMRDDLKISILDEENSNKNYSFDKFLVWLNGRFINQNEYLDEDHKEILIRKGINLLPVERISETPLLGRPVQSKNDIPRIDGDNATVIEKHYPTELRLKRDVRLFGWDGVTINGPYSVIDEMGRTEVGTMKSFMYGDVRVNVFTEIKILGQMRKKGTFILFMNGKIIDENLYEISYTNNSTVIKLEKFQEEVFNGLNANVDVKDPGYEGYVRKIVEEIGTHKNTSIAYIECDDIEKEVCLYRDSNVIRNVPAPGYISFDEVGFNDLILFEGEYIPYIWKYGNSIMLPDTMNRTTSNDYIASVNVFKLFPYFTKK